MRLIWSDTALIDVEAHVDYLAQVNKFSAAELTVALLGAGDSLMLMPHRGRPGRMPGTRELVAVFPYIIVYQVGSDAVEIIRVWHGKLLA